MNTTPRTPMEAVRRQRERRWWLVIIAACYVAGAIVFAVAMYLTRATVDDERIRPDPPRARALT